MSALPDAILHKILSLLPTKHSVQTSILSERWIHLWKFTPVIHILMYSPYKHITPSECTFMHTLGTNTKLRNSISSASSSPLDPCGIMTLMFNTALSLPFQDRFRFFQFQLIYAQQCLNNTMFSLTCFIPMRMPDH
ncbi:hypothetical protein Godav_002354 [Gossypium davidsonii]|uniref:F-box domain-containing protein n=1 Tax=Gossypium davidsonii TaxID=34287 RepID=A0A7J8SWN0_GOSDV|nr:hypothetical protein [Gossypium davidsonii]